MCVQLQQSILHIFISLDCYKPLQYADTSVMEV